MQQKQLRKQVFHDLHCTATFRLSFFKDIEFHSKQLPQLGPFLLAALLKIQLTLKIIKIFCTFNIKIIENIIFAL